MMIIDCVPTALGAELTLANVSGVGRGCKGSLWAGGGIYRWRETERWRLAKWLLPWGDSVLMMDQIWWPRKGPENNAIFKTVASKVRSSSKVEAEVGFRQMWEPGSPMPSVPGQLLTNWDQRSTFPQGANPFSALTFSLLPSKYISSIKALAICHSIHLSF